MTSDKFYRGAIVREGLDTDTLIVGGTDYTAGAPTGPTGPTGAVGATGPTGSQNASASAPANASAAGTAGTVAYDSGFVYVCTATNTWKRVAIATW